MARQIPVDAENCSHRWYNLKLFRNRDLSGTLLRKAAKNNIFFKIYEGHFVPLVVIYTNTVSTESVARTEMILYILLSAVLILTLISGDV